METVELSRLDDFAQKMLDMLRSLEQKPQATLVALRGDLGSGKTTFVQTLAKALGITETLQSPTYVLMKSYNLPKNTTLPFTKLVHIDAYRLENPKQFAALKPEQFLQDPKALVCIEWPERVEGKLPKPDLFINFSSEGMKESERGVEVEK
ncbi:MAG TPA: tRNA (adenosine(37)-N6)-threonylcarbamoyltransferase complex ATPase subunit type 1 TsaE [Candidatus Paceibacterota bacterium]|nr:tRNA (adenosine(37)-N6)-threonylcarbamoyltransferase complex ATPase subunit type 1 TsaE [Candidatus Paceibacterota bacterium]